VHLRLPNQTYDRPSTWPLANLVIDSLLVRRSEVGRHHRALVCKVQRLNPDRCNDCGSCTLCVTIVPQLCAHEDAGFGSSIPSRDAKCSKSPKAATAWRGGRQSDSASALKPGADKFPGDPRAAEGVVVIIRLHPFGDRWGAGSVIVRQYSPRNNFRVALNRAPSP
jgi:ferredoxin